MPAYNLQEGHVGEEQRRLDAEADRREARERQVGQRSKACVHDVNDGSWCSTHEARFDAPTDRVCRWVAADVHVREVAEKLGRYPWLQPLKDAVARIEYKDWRFVVDVEPSTGAPYLQIVFEDPTQEPKTQYCRKWLLYRTMNASEAVRTAWAAVVQAEEHEARERFRYRGRRIMGPHFDVDKLVDFYARKENIAPTKDPVPS